MNKLTDTIHQEMIEMMLVTSYSNISICPLIFLQIKYFDVNYGITFQIHEKEAKDLILMLLHILEAWLVLKGCIQNEYGKL